LWSGEEREREEREREREELPCVSLSLSRPPSLSLASDSSCPSSKSYSQRIGEKGACQENAFSKVTAYFLWKKIIRMII